MFSNAQKCSKSGYKELYNLSVLYLELHTFWWKMIRELRNFWVAELFRLELTFMCLDLNSLIYTSIYVYVVLKFHSYTSHIKSSFLLWDAFLFLLDVLVTVLFLLLSILSECTLLKIILALTCSVIQLIGIVVLSLTMKGFSMIPSNCFQIYSLFILFRCRSWLVKYFLSCSIKRMLAWVFCFVYVSSFLLNICTSWFTIDDATES